MAEPFIGQIITAGFNFNVALKGDGSVVAWGDDTLGETDVPGDLNGVKGIAARFFHALAVRTNGAVVSWGVDTAGQSSVPLDLSNVTAVATGHYHSLALKNDGTVVGWGSNDQDQTTIPSNAQGAFAIAAGGEFSLALTAPLSPIILNIGLTNAHVLLQFTNAPNLNISIQGSTNLLNWDPLGSAVDRGNGYYDFEDLNAGGVRARFYRTVF